MYHKVDDELIQEVEDILYDGFYNWQFKSHTLDEYIKYVKQESWEFRQCETEEIQKAYKQDALERLSERMSYFSRYLYDFALSICPSQTLETLETEEYKPYDLKFETDIDIFEGEY